MQPLRTADRAEHPDQDRSRRPQQRRRQREQTITKEILPNASIRALLPVVFAPGPQRVIRRDVHHLGQDGAEHEEREADLGRGGDVLHVHVLLYAALLDVLLCRAVRRGRTGRWRRFDKDSFAEAPAALQLLGERVDVLLGKLVRCRHGGL